MHAHIKVPTEVICKMSEVELPFNTRGNLFKHDQWPINTWKQTWGINSNNGVRNISAQIIIIPETIPDTPDFAPLSWFTADLEKDPALLIEKYSNINIYFTFKNKFFQVKS